MAGQGSASLVPLMQHTHFMNKFRGEIKFVPMVWVKVHELVGQTLHGVRIQRPILPIYKGAASVFELEFILQLIVGTSYSLTSYHLVSENADYPLILRREVVAKRRRQHDVLGPKELNRETIPLIHVIRQHDPVL